MGNLRRCWAAGRVGGEVLLLSAVQALPRLFPGVPPVLEAIPCWSPVDPLLAGLFGLWLVDLGNLLFVSLVLRAPDR